MKGHVNTKNGEISIVKSGNCEICRNLCSWMFWYRRDGNGEYERWDRQAVNKR